MVRDGYRERYSNLLDKQYFNFAAAHFLVFENGEREPLHGHNYRAELEIETRSLDKASLVADFIQVKPLFKAACDRLDHKVLLPARCEVVSVEREGSQVIARWKDDTFAFPAVDVLILDVPNTSSEMLARVLCEDWLQRIAEALPDLDLIRVSVQVSESPGQSAIYERSWD
ncbi:MAG: 6-pyruvoyl tetrahydropterin synthase family protein [Planctomycetota bacterium]